MLTSLFDLEVFDHRQIFDGLTYPWEVLFKIGKYLRQLELGQIQGEVSNQAYLIDPHLISIGEGSVVEPGAYIKGPCVLGKNCTVRHGAYIRGDFLAGDHCMIGHCTEVKNAIFLNQAQAGHFSYVGDSILGNGVNLGAGFKCANVRFDRRDVRVGEVDTGRRKVGAFIGDGAQLGCNGVAKPGAVIEKGAYVQSTC